MAVSDTGSTGLTDDLTTLTYGFATYRAVFYEGVKYRVDLSAPYSLENCRVGIFMESVDGYGVIHIDPAAQVKYEPTTVRQSVLSELSHTR